MQRSVLGSLAILTAIASPAAQHPVMPAGMTHEQHQAQMKKDAELKRRGAAAMGFDQDAVVHHFLLTENGGAIQVEANAAAPAETVTQVQDHLRDISSAFAGGDFAKPFATHDETPPGSVTMRERRSAIRYAFEATARGGRVNVATRDPEALAAVHAFLRYQITEHATGDPLTIRQ